MDILLESTSTLPFKSETDEKTGEIRYFQYGKDEGQEHHGSATVFNKRGDCTSIEFWFNSWRIGQVKIDHPYQKLDESSNFTRYTGWYKKQGGRIKNKKKRLFKFNDHHLSYHKSVKSDSIRDLPLSSIKYFIPSCSGFTIQLMTPKRTFFLEASNSEEMLGLYRNLKSVIRLRKQILGGIQEIKEFLSNPSSIISILNKKTCDLYLHSSGHGMLGYFIKKGDLVLIHDLIKTSNVSQRELISLKNEEFQELMLNWDDPSLCVSLLDLARSRSVDVASLLTEKWIKKFENNKEIDLPLIYELKVRDPVIKFQMWNYLDEQIKILKEHETNLKSNKQLIEKLQTQLSESENIIEQNDKELKNAKEQLIKDEKKINQLENEVKDNQEITKHERGNEKKSSTQIEKENIKYLKNIKQLGRQIEDLKYDLKNKNDAFAILQKDLKNVYQKYEERLKEGKEYSLKINYENKQMNIKMQEKKNKYKKQFEEKNKQIKNQKEKEENLIKKIETIEKKLMEEDEKLKILKDEYKDHEEIDKLLVLNEKLTDERDQFSEKNDKLQSKVEKLESQLTDVSNDKDSLTKKNEKNNQKIQKAEKEISELKIKLFEPLIIKSSSSNDDDNDDDDNDDQNRKNNKNKNKNKNNKKEKGKKTKEENKQNEKTTEKKSVLPKQILDNLEHLQKAMTSFDDYFKVAIRKKLKTPGNERKNQELHFLIQNTLWVYFDLLIKKGLKKPLFGKAKHPWNIFELVATTQGLGEVHEQYLQAFQFVQDYEMFNKKKDLNIKVRAMIRWGLNEKLLATWNELFSSKNHDWSTIYEKDTIVYLPQLFQKMGQILKHLENYELKCFINHEVKN
ncbi:mar-binding filament-like protein [Anaeramoeba flamelloides]|uniref:Mar-binding filament-like protein n=1 Tax=Anaeramoeba flamelloides TaxID=1746091 RepID=A0ABQ8YTY6_9EUKA|nr:mar-binding filament-like protein [Anaeramoeba flamelloides]